MCFVYTFYLFLWDLFIKIFSLYTWYNYSMFLICCIFSYQRESNSRGICTERWRQILQGTCPYATPSNHHKETTIQVPWLQGAPVVGTCSPSATPKESSPKATRVEESLLGLPEPPSNGPCWWSPASRTPAPWGTWATSHGGWPATPSLSSWSIQGDVSMAIQEEIHVKGGQGLQGRGDDFSQVNSQCLYRTRRKYVWKTTQNGYKIPYCW